MKNPNEKVKLLVFIRCYTRKSLLIAAFFIITSPFVLAQEVLKSRPSPLEIVTVKFDETYVKINYGRPHIRDRVIFGDLVPYGKVWRTGANEATEITATKMINIGGQMLAAGTYTIFSIPYEDKWTIILNSDLGQWGAYNYDESKDVLRFDVPTQKTEEKYEPFTIEFELQEEAANILMMWENTKVTIPLTFITE
ncbi:MAG: DUF2911 domain-containing protein [Cyclobacteriaceae bacterium]